MPQPLRLLPPPPPPRQASHPWWGWEVVTGLVWIGVIIAGLLGLLGF